MKTTKEKIRDCERHIFKVRKEIADTLHYKGIDTDVSDLTRKVKKLKNKRNALMRNLVVVLFIFFSLSSYAQFAYFDTDRNTGEEVFISAYVDPTFTDSGMHVGVEITKELLAGWVSVATSHYIDSDKSRVPYRDYIASGGIQWHMFSNDLIKYYGGPRLGWASRGDGEPHAIFGITLGFDVNLDRKGIYKVGARVWTDWRQDQKDEFYGNSATYKPGIIFKNPISQENGAFVLTIRIN